MMRAENTVLGNCADMCESCHNSVVKLEMHFNQEHWQDLVLRAQHLYSVATNNLERQKQNKKIASSDSLSVLMELVHIVHGVHHCLCNYNYRTIRLRLILYE